MRKYKYVVEGFKDGSPRFHETYETKRKAAMRISSMKKTGDYDAIRMSEMVIDGGCFHSIEKHNLYNVKLRLYFDLTLLALEGK